MKTQHHSLQLSQLSRMGLCLSATAMSALAVWQWLELIKVRQGGSAVCALGGTVNCEKVWETPFAHWVQAHLGLPVAAWGLVWGLGALAWALGLGFPKNPAWQGLCVWATRLWALAGALSCVAFAYVSWKAGYVCLSCSGTFALVLVYAFFAFALLPLRAPLPSKSFVWACLSCLALVGFFGTLLQPFGGKTALPADVGKAAASFQSLKPFLASLGPKEREELERARQAFLATQGRPLALPTPGRIPQQAPVVLQDFTDIKCPHCLTAKVALTQLLNSMPPGSVAVEPRYYPLDAECNPPRQASPPPVGVRCAAALAQICLEGTPEFAKLRGELFHASGRLHSRAELVDFLRGKTSAARLEACMDSPEALMRLHADIALAQNHGIRGTPFFLLNGKPVGFAYSFWTAMVLAKGNAEDEAFEALR